MKLGTIVFSLAGIVVGATVGYYFYIKARKEDDEDKDEGIGDVDSIVSEEEVNSLLTPGDLTPTSSAHPDFHHGQDGYISNLENTIFSFSFPECKKKDFDSVKVLVLGLDQCGKTSMLNLLACNMQSDVYQPTIGFNAIQVEKNDLILSIVEVGGSERMRPYWKKFTDQCCILVYVVDGADNLMFKEAKTAFKNLLEDVSLKDVSCLLVANKQDFDNASKAEDIFNEKFVNEIGNRGVSNITLLNTASLVRKDGTSDRDVIMDVIVSLSKERKQSV